MNSFKHIIHRVKEDRQPYAVWNFFILLEIALYLLGTIRLDISLNLLFLLFVLLPSPKFSAAYRSFGIIRFALTMILAVLLLWHQSWLPAPTQVVSLLGLYGLPSFDYMFNFLQGIFTMSTLLSLALIAVASFLLSRLRLVNLAVLPSALIIAPFVSAQFMDTDESYALAGIATAEAAEMEPARYLKAFYEAEAGRKVMFNTPTEEQAPFDIVVLHVCSLSWDDMKKIDLDYDSPFFSQFDYLFSNFNTATGYSTPAVRRLLQANCGQQTHKAIHDDNPPEGCLLFNSLDSAGFQTYVGMSHDGEYGNFLKTIEQLVPKETTVLPIKGLQQQAIFFDGETPLVNDYDVLKRWHKTRESSEAERAALYYNSVLLHAGIRWVGEKRSRKDKEQFTDVTLALLEDMQSFIDELKSSGRNTVVVFVPEHGRALDGTRIQPADVRDIPLPAITKVPLGVKLVGPKFNDASVKQKLVTKPTSYLAVSWLLSRFVENSPFGENAPSADALAFQIPRTEFVAEHEGRVVMEMDEKLFYRDTNGEWSPLTARQLK
ncbi:MAG: cellulose biosynthesis protein BcsG [Pseudomonadota bacterium]